MASTESGRAAQAIARSKLSPGGRYRRFSDIQRGLDPERSTRVGMGSRDIRRLDPQAVACTLLGPIEWLISSADTLPGASPIIAWIGQFFVPLRHLTGEFESAI
jgi:hypothetical protein